MMEPLLETVSLDLEESNELAFKIKVEGAAQSPAKVRLVCEGGDISYMFNGHGTGEDGVVQFILPQMKDKLSEGTYHARVEVLIENRYFSPVSFQINFKKAVKVVAESFYVVPRVAKTDVSVSAQQINVTKPNIQQPIVQNIVVEQQSKSMPVVQKPTIAQVVQEKKPDVKQSQIVSSGSSLKQRYEQKAVVQKRVSESFGDLDDKTIDEIVQSLVVQKKR